MVFDVSGTSNSKDGKADVTRDWTTALLVLESLQLSSALETLLTINRNGRWWSTFYRYQVNSLGPIQCWNYKMFEVVARLAASSGYHAMPLTRERQMQSTTFHSIDESIIEGPLSSAGNLDGSPRNGLTGLGVIPWWRRYGQSFR